MQTVLEAVQHGYNVGGLFVWNVGEDDKNSSRHVLQVTAEGGHVFTELKCFKKFHPKVRNHGEGPY